MAEQNQIFCGEPNVFMYGVGKLQTAIHRAIDRLGGLQQPPSIHKKMTPREAEDERSFYKYEWEKLVEDTQEVVNLLLGPAYVIVKTEE